MKEIWINEIHTIWTGKIDNNENPFKQNEKEKENSGWRSFFFRACMSLDGGIQKDKQKKSKKNDDVCEHCK